MKRMRWHDPIGRYYLFKGLVGRVYLPIIVIFMADKGLSLDQIAVIATAGAAASFIFEVPSGAIADYVGHRRALTFAMLGQALASLCFIGGSFPWILVATVAYFFFGSLMTGTGEALFFEYLKGERRESEHLKLSGEGKSFARIFNIISVLIGGALYSWHSALPFVVSFVQFAVAAWVISTFPNPKRLVSAEKREGFMALMQHFPNALKTIWREPRLFWLTVINAFLAGAVFGSADFQQLILQNLGATTVFIGLLYGLKRVLAMFLSSRVHLLAKHLRPAELMLLLTIICLGHYLLIPLPHSPELLAMIILLATAVYVTLEVVGNDYLNQLIDNHSRATTLSVANFARALVTTLTIASFGLLSHVATIANIYPIIGAIQVVILIVPLFMLARAYRMAS